MSRPEAQPYVTTPAAHQYARGQLFQGFVDYVDPSTRVLDYQAAAPVVDPIYKHLIEGVGLPPRHVRLLAETALRDIQQLHDFKNLLNRRAFDIQREELRVKISI